MKHAQWLLIATLFFSLTGCKYQQEQPMEYGIVVQLDKAWMPNNLLEYPFTRWTYMFKPDGRKITPPRRFGFSTYAGHFSPDWKWLAYQDTVWDDYRVYVMRMSDGKKIRISNETSSNYQQWINEHTLAYTSVYASAGSLYESGEKVHIQDISCLSLSGRLSSDCLPPPTIIDLGINSEFWGISPSGEKILYMHYEYGGKYEGVPVKAQQYLMVIGQPPIALMSEGNVIGFVDETRVLVVSPEELYIGKINKNGQVVRETFIASVDRVYDMVFAFSPDRKYIAFISDRKEYGLGEIINPYAPIEDHPFTSALFVMNVTTGEVRRLTYPNDHQVIWFDWYPLQ